MPALPGFGVEEHEAVARQAGVHALADRAVGVGDGAVVEQERVLTSLAAMSRVIWSGCSSRSAVP
jgi:hypothetical protein